MQNLESLKIQNILPEIKNQTFTNSFQNKQLLDNNKPGTSYQGQRQGQKNVNYASQVRQIKLDEVPAINMKNGQKLSLNNIKDQQFQEEIADLMQIQVAQEYRAARNIEKHFKKVIPNTQYKSRNLSESSGVGRNVINQQYVNAIQNNSFNQNIDINTDEIGLFVPTNVEKLRNSIKNDFINANNKEPKPNKKIKEQKPQTFGQKPTTPVVLQKPVQDQLQVTVKNQKDFILKRQRVRGPQGLNIKVVEMWINDTICEAESEISIPNQQKNNEGGDKIRQNSPQKKQSDQKDILKSFQLDRKSLANKGISKENIDRIYRSLFVYSFGFYEMIQDIFSHVHDSARIVANVWKIYGILLEYCSRTDFVNTVTQLEKEKTAIVDNLEEQIVSKQQQIDELEVIEKEKREILEQQILSLKQEKQNIINEKFQLEEDFKQADAAFNEEVGLRLQFEHKINELHSIHRELLMKHNRLIDDYDSLKVEHDILKADQDNNNKLINSLKIMESKTKDECRDLQRKVTEATIQFEKLKERAVQAEAELQHKNRGADKYEGLLNEEQRINEDLRFQLKNLQEKIDLQQRNEDIYKRRIDELKGEQKYYNQKMDNQSERFEKLQQKIYDLEKEIIDQKTTAQLKSESYAQLRGQCQAYENDILELQGQKKKVEQEYEYCLNRNELLQTDLEALQKLIKDMKVGRIELEEEYIKCKLRLNNSMDTIKAKNELCKDLEIKMEIYEQNHLKLTVEFQTYQNMATKEQDSLKQKISKLDRELKSKIHEQETEKKQNEFVNQKIDQYNEQIEGLRKEILELTSQQREDKFTLNNQANNINQLTNVIEAERSRNTDLIKQVTSLTTINENLQRETKSQKVIIRELQDNHATTIEQLKQQHKKDIDRYTNVEFKVHLMVYEDLLSRFSQMQQDKIRLDQQNFEIQQALELKIKQLNDVQNLQVQTNEKLQQTQKMLSKLKKYSLHFLQNVLTSDKRAESLDKQLKENKNQIILNEKQYKQEREIIIKLNEQQEKKLRGEIKQQQNDLDEMKELVNQKLEQIRQLQESYQLIEQLKNQQQQQLSLKNEGNQRGSMQMLNKTGQLELTQQQIQQIQQTQQLSQIYNSQPINQNQQQNTFKQDETSQNLTMEQRQMQLKEQDRLQQIHYNSNGVYQDNNKNSVQQDQAKGFEHPTIQNGLSNKEGGGGQANKNKQNLPNPQLQQQQQQLNQQQKNQNQLDNYNEQLVSKQQQLFKQNYMAEQNESHQYGLKQKYNNRQNHSFSYSQEDQFQPMNGNILTQENIDNRNERLISENVLDSNQGQFVPYHLSTLGRMNYSTNYNNKNLSESTPQNNQNNQIRKPSQSFYSGGAYRLTQDHSKFIQNQVTKKLKQQTKENKEFGKLFRLASGHYDNSQS